MQSVSVGARDALCAINRRTVVQMTKDETARRDFYKIVATSGLLSYSTVVKGGGLTRQITGEAMSNSSLERNKAIVLEAFETLFNKRDYAAAERFWSPKYIQHSANIAPGREGLFDLVKAAPAEFRYENGLAVASGDYVVLHGRFSGFGAPVNWIVADIVRIENGQLAEHWDVIQDEATRDGSNSGLPMFGNTFPN